MARSNSFGKDPGLQARMILTIFLLGLVYVVLIGALFASGASGVMIAVIAGGLFLFQLFASDKLALAVDGRARSQPRSRRRAPRDDRAALRPGRPAQAAGRGHAQTRCPTPSRWAARRSHATVCATTGILDLLSPAELEGVLAHELTHVQNRDVMVMTIASFFATIASYIVQFGFFFGGGRRRRRRRRPGSSS